MLFAFALTGGMAEAQGPPPAPSESSSATPPSNPPSLKPIVPAPVAPVEDDAGATAPPRQRGASVRERGGRRSRGASTASGVLFLVILVGAMGWYVVKRLRR